MSFLFSFLPLVLGTVYGKHSNRFKRYNSNWQHSLMLAFSEMLG
jgi:hypothetical protein